MAKRKLGVDIDGTLANTVDAFIRKMKHERGLILDRKTIINYDMTKHVPLSRAQMSQAWAELWANHEQIELEDNDAPEVLRGLSKNFEIHIVTATNAKDDELKKWLGKKGITYDKIQHFEHQIEKVNSKVDVHVDDCFDLSESFVKSGIKLIVFEQPWNHQGHEFSKTEKLVSMANSWKEVGGILNREFPSGD